MKTLLILCMLAALLGCGGSVNVVPVVPATVSLAASSSSISESSGSNITLTATLSHATDEVVTVSFATSGVATAGTDYATIANITIAVGDTNGTASFTPMDDAVYEGDEEAAVAISSVAGAGASTSGSQSVSITIRENEIAPTVSLAASSASISENSGINVTLTVTLSHATDEVVTVSFSTSGVATAGTDYAAIANITVAAGDTTGTTSLTPTDDTVYEGDEVATVAIASVAGGGATQSGSQSVSITITENENAPSVSLAASGTSIYDNGSSIIITATSTQIAQAAITVSINTSGTAIEGVDYAAIADIVIAAGATTGTTSFNPIADTSNEGDETAIMTISAVAGANANIGGSASVTITINEYALRTATAFVEGTAAEQTAITSNLKWRFVDYSGSASSVHPYEQMNIHKVQSFASSGVKLTGEGQRIHIADFNCDDTHEIYANKTIYNLDDGGVGESTFSAATAANYHCQFVASIAAGDSIGASQVMGVAPDADLVLSSIGNTIGSYTLDDFATDIDAAYGYGAIVSNNSWVYLDNTDGNANAVWNVTEVKNQIASFGFSTNEGFAYRTIGNASTQAQTVSQQYITALNNFQQTGVVVFAAGNYSGESDVSFMAGLPELYPQLAEAWLAVGFVDFTGSSMATAVESDFTLRGNKCGSAKEYCVVADGYQLNGASYGTNNYATGKSGSSFSAPMVSGGIALLAQAFPNHTSEQLTDRLLASANNTWFTPEGQTTFTTHGNSITHGYHSTWGQGIPDFYAALSPITSSSNPSLALYIGASIQSGSASPLASSVVIASSSYGDTISDGLKDEHTYTYDALSGGFKIEMASLVRVAKQAKPLIDFNQSFANLDKALITEQPQLTTFKRVISELNNDHNQMFRVTMGSKTIPVQSFLGSNIDSGIDMETFSTPYLSQSSEGVGLGATYPIADGRLLLGVTVPVNDSSVIIKDKNTSITASIEKDWKHNSTVTLLTGFNSNAAGPLGMTGYGALDMSDAGTKTNFIVAKSQSKLTNNFALTAVAAVSNSSSSTPSTSLLGSTRNIRSSSIGLGATMTDILGKGAVSMLLSQPDRVFSGDINIGIPQLADAEGNITKKSKVISLSPSARQLDFKLIYTDDIFTDTGIRLEYAVSRNINHVQAEGLARAGFIGVHAGGLKIGAKLTPHWDLARIEMRYGARF